MPRSRVLLLQHGADAADAGAGGFFLQDLELAELAGVADVRAAADFLREIAHGVDLDLLAVLAGEKGHGAIVLCLLQAS